MTRKCPSHPLPFRGGAARLTSLLVSRSGVGKLAAHSICFAQRPQRSQRRRKGIHAETRRRGGAKNPGRQAPSFPPASMTSQRPLKQGRFAANPLPPPPRQIGRATG